MKVKKQKVKKYKAIRPEVSSGWYNIVDELGRDIATCYSPDADKGAKLIVKCLNAHFRLKEKQ